MFLYYVGCIFVCTLENVRIENTTLTWRRQNYQWRVAKYKAIFSANGQEWIFILRHLLWWRTSVLIMLYNLKPQITKSLQRSRICNNLLFYVSIIYCYLHLKLFKHMELTVSNLSRKGILSFATPVESLDFGFRGFVPGNIQTLKYSNFLTC